MHVCVFSLHMNECVLAGDAQECRRCASASTGSCDETRKVQVEHPGQGCCDLDFTRVQAAGSSLEASSALALTCDRARALSQ